MKLKTVFRLFWIFIFSLFFASCKKNNQPPTKSQLLVSSAWKLKSATIAGADAMHFIQDCQKDNTIGFSSNGRGIISEGASKCNAGDPDSVPFTWTLKNNETVLNISVELYRHGSNDMDLKKITATTLELTLTYTPPVGPSRLIDLTFEH